MLEIKNLHVNVNKHEILKGINLIVKPGEIHAIMGPNGAGKSTLANILAGHKKYTITKGEILYKGKDLIKKTPDERANEGIFLAFQYPIEISGVSTMNFLKTAINEKRKYNNLPTLDAVEFIEYANKKKEIIGIHDDLMKRSLNSGFSGGEKKKNEVFQMAILEPDLSILDETDSGLDIDALKVIADGVNKLHTKKNSAIIITHYQRLLDYIIPDHIHILHDGEIIKSGDKTLALELEKKGYKWINNNTN